MPSLNLRRIKTEYRPVPTQGKRARNRTRPKEEKPAPDRESQARSYIWRRRLQTVRRVAAVLMLAIVMAGSWWAWRDGYVDQLIVFAQEQLPTVSDMPGLTVQKIEVTGHDNIPSAEVSNALGVEPGAKIADIDLTQVREKVEALGWVHRARIARLLPDTLRVEITERVPFALWQHEGVLRLIDPSGEEITQDGLNRFASLPMVVGRGAAPGAQDVLAVLDRQPDLEARVQAAVRVGERRWDIRFNNGITVRLPELGAAAAWDRLADLERNQGILGRDIAALDMRLPDRLIVRLTPEAAKARHDANDDRT